MSSKGRVLLKASLLGVGLLATWGIWQLTGHEESRRHASSTKSERKVASHAGRDDVSSLREIWSSAEKAAPVRQQPLPPLSLPFSTTFPDLKGRAETGDSWAQCQLAVELIRCRDAIGILENAELSAKLARTENAGIGDAQSREFFARISKQRFSAVATTADQCADVPPDEFSNAQKYLREAAISGHGDAALMYLEGRGFDQANLSGVLRDPEFRVWHENARAIVTARAIGGDARSAWILAFGFTRFDQTPLDALLGDDEASAFMFSNLVALLSGQPIAERSETLSPRQVSAINERARQIFRSGYGGRVLGEDAVRFDPIAAEATQEKTRYGCDGSSPGVE